MATSSLKITALQNLTVAVNSLNQAFQAYFAAKPALAAAADDAAAAAAGVKVGQLYENNGTVRVRLT